MVLRMDVSESHCKVAEGLGMLVLDHTGSLGFTHIVKTFVFQTVMFEGFSV